MVTKAELKPLRVVFDTNVILSALLFRAGRVSWIVPLWRTGRLVPLVSKESFTELIRVLKYPKFALTRLDRQAVLEAFLPYAETVRIQPKKDIPLCRDPHDQKFLLLATCGHADKVVTGDKDLLSVEGFSTCPIITPDQLRDEIAAAPLV
jgi:uncharacterized protein